MSNQFDVSATTQPPAIQELNPIFRDYIAATGAPCIWLDPNKPEDELPLYLRILESFDSNAAYMGWFPNGDEMPGITQTAQNSLFVAAADFFFSGILMSGLRNLFSISSNSTGVRRPTSEVSIKNNKIYLSMTWGEGDNISYDQHRLRLLWEDPKRGDVPVGWTISPLLRDIASNMLNYYQSTATKNDLLVTGPSGVGYTYPVNWPSDDFQVFPERTGEYTQVTGLQSHVWVYNRINSTTIQISDQIARGYQQAMPGLLGISADPAPGAVNPNAINITADGLPIAGLLRISGVQSGLDALNKVSVSYFNGSTNGTIGPFSNATTNSTGRAPLFVACSLEAFATTPGNASALASQLDSDEFVILRYVFVGGDFARYPLTLRSQAR
jgi:hypothetical protein